MSSTISSAIFCQDLRVVGLVVQPGELGAPVHRHPAHELRAGEVLRLAAHLPDAPVRLVPVLRGLLDLPLEDGPQRLGELVARLGVQPHGVEHRAPHVVLPLVVRGVADPDGLRALVAGQVRQLELLQGLLATHAVHDLELPVVAADVLDEREEVVRLAFQAEGVQPPERERRVADPRVPVVPVALPARGLGQRRGGGGDQRAGGGVGQPLQRQRRPLQVDAPRVVGELALRDPVAPEPLRAPHRVQGARVAGPARSASPRTSRRSAWRPPSSGYAPSRACPPARTAGWSAGAGPGWSRRCAPRRTSTRCSRTPSRPRTARSPGAARTRPRGPPCPTRT